MGDMAFRPPKALDFLASPRSATGRSAICQNHSTRVLQIVQRASHRSLHGLHPKRANLRRLHAFVPQSLQQRNDPILIPPIRPAPLAPRYPDPKGQTADTTSHPQCSGSQVSHEWRHEVAPPVSALVRPDPLALPAGSYQILRNMDMQKCSVIEGIMGLFATYSHRQPILGFLFERI